MHRFFDAAEGWPGPGCPPGDDVLLGYHRLWEETRLRVTELSDRLRAEPDERIQEALARVSDLVAFLEEKRLDGPFLHEDPVRLLEAFHDGINELSVIHNAVLLAVSCRELEDGKNDNAGFRALERVLGMAVRARRLRSDPAVRRLWRRAGVFLARLVAVTAGTAAMLFLLSQGCGATG